jgi:hypothetical protein
VPSDEDESNLINREDFEEGKTKAIVTSRETPVKHSGMMARKNMSTTRKQLIIADSPTLQGAINYRDPANPNQLYYQIPQSHKLNPPNTHRQNMDVRSEMGV